LIVWWPKTATIDADRGDHDDEREGDQPVAAAEKLGACLGRDHAVDGEPTDGEEECQRRADIRTAKTEDAARVDDLREPCSRAGVAEEAEDDRGSDGPQRDCEQSVPDAKPVVGGEQ